MNHPINGKMFAFAVRYNTDEPPDSPEGTNKALLRGNRGGIIYSAKYWSRGFRFVRITYYEGSDVPIEVLTLNP